MLSKLKQAANKRSYFSKFKKQDAKRSLLQEEEEATSGLEQAWHQSSEQIIYMDFIEDEKCTAAEDLLMNKWEESNFRNNKPFFNKIFSCEWLSNDSLLFGTKDNKLYYYNTNLTNLIKMEMPQPDIVNIYNDITDVDNYYYKYKNKGLYCITSNDQKKYVLANGYYSNDITLYGLDENKVGSEKLSAITILKNHKSWVSSIKWLNYDRFVSTSFDGTITIWSLSNVINTYELEGSNNIPEISNYYVTNKDPITKNKINTNIRSMDIHKYNKCNVTLSSDGYVNIFDTNRDNKEIYNKLLPYNTQTVDVNVNDNKNTIAVASFEYLQLFDPRAESSSYTLKKSLDRANLGIRSIEWLSDNILSIGGSSNSLFFYDIRNNQYLNTKDSSSNNINPNNVLKCKDGNLRYDDISTQYIENDSKVVNYTSIFTHKYSPNKDKLFVGGGPTHAPLYGNKMSIFSKSQNKSFTSM